MSWLTLTQGVIGVLAARLIWDSVCQGVTLSQQVCVLQGVLLAQQAYSSGGMLA
jgi:hypothetical protein